MNRENYSSGSPWENIVGYSRAVKIGNILEISGTTATSESGEVLGVDDPYEQAKIILNKIQLYVNLCGASMQDIIRTRIYVTDINQWEEIARAHAEFFNEIKPACTMVEVKRLIDPKMLLEIEATAVLF